MWASFNLRNIALMFFFSLGCSLVLRMDVWEKGTQVGKVFFASAISRKRSDLKRENYGILHNIPEQSCMRNLERFRQSLLLIKILMPFIRGALQINEAGPLL